ncbi:MAG: TlpA family protein disulfide reductase [Chloroflexi bacterium]|nr:TlpA family protein disulfide reductase [Chloroflexota bacterium]
MIRRILKLIVLASVLSLLALLLFPATAFACPTCQEQSSQPGAFGLSLSVLFMLSIPFLLVGFIGWQLARALDPQGYERFQARITARLGPRRVYIAVGVALIPLLFFAMQPGAVARTIPLPRAQFAAQTNLNGAPIAATQLEDKIVLVNFFAAWCVPCRDEARQLGALYREYHPRGVEIVGVALDFERQDEPAAQPHIHADGGVHFHAAPNQLALLLEFIQSHRVSYPVVPVARQISDPFGGVPAIPATFLFNRQGTLVKTYIGPAPIETLQADVQTLFNK